MKPGVYRIAFGIGLSLLAIAAVLILSLPASAQLNTGRISGAVTDQTGGAIGGAKVSIVDVARGETRPLIADAAGNYAAPNLTPGTYTVRVEFMGFQTFERQNVDVGVGSDVRVDVTLQPGEQTQTITVTESIPVINTTNAQTGGVIENKVLNDLPVNGRNYRWQQAMVPGVTVAPGEGTGNIDANGTNDGHGSNTLLDGVADQSYFVAELTFGGTSEGGDTTILPLDAIQEVNMVVNPKAEYGWIPGVTANVGLKSGTNNMHGDAYAYGRTSALYARNPFSSSATADPVEYEQYGGTLGGPIKKDKLFYFMGYEAFRESLTSNVSETPPTLTTGGVNGLSIPDSIADIISHADATHTNGFGLTGLPALNRLSLNIAGCDLSKLNNSMTTGAAVVASGACSANQFGAPGLWANPNIGVLPNDGRSDNGLAKLDYHVNDHHSLNGLFAKGYYVENAAANSAAKIAQNYWEEILGVKAQMGRVEWIWTPTSSLLNEARWGIDQQARPTSRTECSNGLDPFSDSLGLNSTAGHFGGPDYVTQYGLLSGAPGCGFPTIILANPVSAQLGFSNNKAHTETDIQGNDALSYTRGTHQFKFGTEVRAIDFVGAKVQDQQSGVINFGQSGSAAFTGATSLESFLEGVASSEAIRGGSLSRDISEKLIAVFAQDDWRIVPRLTLNLGVREEIVTPMTIPDASMGNFNPLIGSSDPTGVIAERTAWNTHYKTLPHFGFAWDLTGKGKTTLRAGAGLAYGLPTLMNFIAGSGTIDLTTAPTGENLFHPDGTFVSSPGSGRSSQENLQPNTGSGATKGVVVSNFIPWPSNSVNSATTPLFPSPLPESCGNGQLQTAPGNPAVKNPALCKMYAVDPNLEYYKYIFWNVNFQHAFTNNLSLDIGYVGSRSTDLQTSNNLNQAQPTNDTSLANSTQEQARSVYSNPTTGVFPWFSTITYGYGGLSDTYHSLQMYLVERPARGLAFTAAYTLNRNLETQAIQNIYNPVNQYGGNNDPAHHLAINFTYDLPGIKSPGQMLQGWGVHGSWVYESSLSQSPVDTKDDLTGTGVSNGTSVSDTWSLYGSADPFNKIFGRAGTIPCYGVSGVTTSSLKSAPCIQVLAGPSNAPWQNMPAACIQGATQEPSFPGSDPNNANTKNGLPLYQLAAIGCYMVNGSAIVPPAQGTYGNLLRDELRGPGESLVNLAISKEWKLKERYSAQFRAEFYNLFNRTMYAGQGVNLGSPNLFGAATGTPNVIQGGGASFSGGPRQVQLGLKLLF